MFALAMSDRTRASCPHASTRTAAGASRLRALGVWIACAALACTHAAAAATFTVNVSDDVSDANPGDGFCRAVDAPAACTLRAAMEEANALHGHDTIAFAIGSGARTIAPLSELPTITDPVTIDGTTQPGFVDRPIIEVNGENTLPLGFFRGFIITSGGSTLRGLVINTFGFDGILIEDGGGNVIAGNYIGTDPTGTIGGNDFGNGGHGIWIYESPGNTIGGTRSEDRNLISGNNFGLSGITIDGTGASGNVVQGNLIGTDVTGTVALANTGGINVWRGSDNLIGGTAAGAGNLISGNEVNSGIVIANGATRTIIAGNLIGTDITGTHELGNDEVGIIINSDDNLVGGILLGARNVISGNHFPFTNSGNGVSIGPDGHGNRIEGNYIGTDITGSYSLGEQEFGVRIDGGSDNVVGGGAPGAGNLISGNLQFGVHVFGDGNIVQGNLIGTDASGLEPIGNCYGVNVSGKANLIGGTTSGERNVIAASTERGIQIFAGPGASANRVLGNYIGTDVTGTALLGNVEVGIRIDSSKGNMIGGSEPGTGNVIAGNGDGVYIGQSTAVGCGITGDAAGAARPETVGANVVRGNAIGTDASGAVLLGNRGRGVVVDGPTANTIASNVIAASALAGVDISSSENTVSGNEIEAGGGAGVVVRSGSGNGILGNAISDNAALGIDLGDDGVTSNDALDVDAGANGSQNHPVLASARSLGGRTLVRGVLSSAAAAEYTLQFFASAACDPSGHGEGGRFLGSKAVATDDAGLARFNAALAVSVPPGAFVTATATDAAESTSEYSACVRIP